MSENNSITILIGAKDKFDELNKKLSDKFKLCEMNLKPEEDIKYIIDNSDRIAVIIQTPKEFENIINDKTERFKNIPIIAVNDSYLDEFDKNIDDVISKNDNIEIIERRIENCIEKYSFKKLYKAEKIKKERYRDVISELSSLIFEYNIIRNTIKVTFANGIEKEKEYDANIILKNIYKDDVKNFEECIKVVCEKKKMQQLIYD